VFFTPYRERRTPYGLFSLFFCPSVCLTDLDGIWYRLCAIADYPPAYVMKGCTHLYDSYSSLYNNIGKAYSLEYTNIPKTLFTLHHVRRSRTNVITVYVILALSFLLLRPYLHCQHKSFLRNNVSDNDF
jgi:hypothetical protein